MLLLLYNIMLDIGMNHTANNYGYFIYLQKCLIAYNYCSWEGSRRDKKNLQQLK